MKYKRVLLKLSGESLMGEKQFGIDPVRITQFGIDIKEVVSEGTRITSYNVCYTKLLR